jgi:hypothetical protein
MANSWRDGKWLSGVILEDCARVDKGTLPIQGHDPTTNLSFRHIRARELAQ